ncbi:MAG TPA: CPBP family intramembrane glutamic endopeptidase [bacterium]
MIRSVLALALLVPAPTLGVFAAMVWFPGTPLGKGVFVATKLWLFLLPVLWLRLVDREPLSLSPMRRGGLAAGALSGVGVGLLIVAAYRVLGPSLVDRTLFAGRMREVGLDAWQLYVGAAAYWVLVNSVLEEYVWRWFVCSRCEALVGPAAAAALSAFFFTLHHYFAVRTYFPVALALLCSAGVFVGGLVWSFLYLRYRSIWPAYSSHAIVDLAVFGTGAYVLWG